VQFTIAHRARPYLLKAGVNMRRTIKDISSAIDELVDKVWYNRHQIAKEDIAKGKVVIVEEMKFAPHGDPNKQMQRDVWERAEAAASKMEQRYGVENLGPWDDFAWGEINGKLSALRWVLGEEWDMLDT
jgi:hypothetical protein